MGYIGMCGPKGYGFSAILVINWVSILVILPPFQSISFNLFVFLEEATSSSRLSSPICALPSSTLFNACLKQSTKAVHLIISESGHK